MATVIQRFAKDNRGTFTALLRHKPGAQRASGERIPFTIAPPIGQDMGIMAPINGVNYENVEDMRQKIRLEMRQELENERLIEEIREMQRQQVVNSSLDNRLANVLEKLLTKTKLFSDAAAAPAPIQGTTTNATSINQKNTMGKFDIDDLDTDAMEKMEETIAVIYSHLGPDTMHQVAAALTRDPSLGEKLKLFI
jgi:hypothetical protein